VYTGRTERPCCLCGRGEPSHRIEVPPRAIELMDNSGSIAWRDVVGAVTLSFCEDDWATVRHLALEAGMHPLPRCNAAHAEFDLRADYEALLNATRETPDQTALEGRLLDRSREALAARDDPLTEERDLVEATVIRLALSELGVDDASKSVPDA